MPLEELIARPITGIRPFNELPIDAEIWREAHEHHHVHRQLHAAAAHRPGIVVGLDVVASAVRERTIVVSPGVGIDADGQTVVKPDGRRFPPGDWDGLPSQVVATGIESEKVLDLIRDTLLRG